MNLKKIKFNLDMMLMTKTERAIVDGITDTIKDYEQKYPSESKVTQNGRDLVYDAMLVMGKGSLLQLYCDKPYITSVVDTWISEYR